MRGGYLVTVSIEAAGAKGAFALPKLVVLAVLPLEIAPAAKSSVVQHAHTKLPQETRTGIRR